MGNLFLNAYLVCIFILALIGAALCFYGLRKKPAHSHRIIRNTNRKNPTRVYGESEIRPMCAKANDDALSDIIDYGSGKNNKHAEPVKKILSDDDLLERNRKDAAALFGSDYYERGYTNVWASNRSSHCKDDDRGGSSNDSDSSSCGSGD